MNENPGKFHSNIIDKKKQKHTAEYISIDQKNIKISSSAKLLGVHVDDKLSFNLHITKICRSAANQLYALIRLRMFLNFEEKKTLINSYFYSSFNYCPLVWMFSSAKSKLGKRLWKRLRSLCIEIYKTINNINPMYMDETFKLRKASRAVRSNYKLI